MSLLVKKITDNASLPTKGSDGSAGYDLYSAYDITINGNGKSIIKTDISIKMPDGVYGRIAPRSGLSWKKHTIVSAGVIDPDYTGNIGIVLFNLSNEDLEIKKGDRVAQLIFEKFLIVDDIKEVDSLDITKRGNAGYGSTGK